MPVNDPFFSFHYGFRNSPRDKCVHDQRLAGSDRLPVGASAHNHSGEQLANQRFIVCHENGFRQGINGPYDRRERRKSVHGSLGSTELVAKD
jgi:hypothetical protein